MVAPNEEADDGDRQARGRDERVAEDALAREAGDDLADDPHRRQDHDVDGGVRVEPEEVLVENRIAAQRRVEDPHAQQTLDRHQEDRDRDDRRAENHDQARRVVRPHEQRQPEPGQPRRPHLVDGDDEVQAGEDRREADDEHADRRQRDSGIRVRAAVGRVERPARVHAAGEDRGQREQATERVDVPAREVQAREGEVLRADHERQQEVAEHRRDRRDQEEEDHHDAVHGEHAVVGLGAHQIARRSHQLGTNRRREQSAESEEGTDGDEIQDGNPLVIDREQPRLESVRDVQVVLARHIAFIPVTTSTRPRFLTHCPAPSAVPAAAVLVPCERM